MSFRPEDDSTARLRLADFDFTLPTERIAQYPLADRDAARLLVLDGAGDSLVHSHVRDIGRWLRAGDLLVFNDTRVRPARLFGRTETGALIELMLLSEGSSGVWECLGRPGKRLRPGKRVTFADGSGAVVQSQTDRRLDVAFDDPPHVADLLATHGQIPLPPYIERPEGPTADDLDRYQTMFARVDGAIAAPTAGLHFTPKLLQEIRSLGVETACVTLHVGAGTFLPVADDDVLKHEMAAEQATISEAVVAAVETARCRGGRVIAVGTTTTRALESASSAEGKLSAGDSTAGLFITPGYRFRVIDGLLTNFHLPKSTLLLLVSALAGRQRLLDAYDEAIRRDYRFYSFGDAMLIL